MAIGVRVSRMSLHSISMPLQTFVAKAAAAVAGGGAKRVIGIHQQRMRRASSIGRRPARLSMYPEQQATIQCDASL